MIIYALNNSKSFVIALNMRILPYMEMEEF